MKPSPLKIGPLVIGNPALLAPMAGLTDSAFRTLCLDHRCGLVFTELVTAEGITRGHKKTLHYLETVPEEHPIAAHLYGHEPSVMAAAAAKAEAMKRFDLIDINGGCPVSKIMSRGAGAGLLRSPEKMYAMVAAVRKAVSLPVTVKTRIGLSKKVFNGSEVAQAIEEAGASAMFLHARLASDWHNGPPDLATLARIKSERKIPVIGNGGIWKAEEADEMIRQTGVDGIMIGRGALGKPWLFEEIYSRWNGQEFCPPDKVQKRGIMIEHLERLRALAAKEQLVRRKSRLDPEGAACLFFRPHLVKYLSGYRGLRDLARNFDQLLSFADLLSAVDKVLKENGPE